MTRLFQRGLVLMPCVFSGPRTRTPFSLRRTWSPRNHLLCEDPLFMQPESPGLSTTRCKMHQDALSLLPSTAHTSRPVSPRAFDPAQYPAGFCSLSPSGSLAMRDASCQSGMYLEKGKAPCPDGPVKQHAACLKHRT